MKKALAVLVLAVSSLSFMVSAGSATTSHANYALGKAKKCRVDFVKKTEKHTVIEKVKGKKKRVVERYVACVYSPPAPTATHFPVITPTTIATAVTNTVTPAPTTTQPPVPSYNYEAHVDPSFTQSPANPMAVTYTYTADATQTVNGKQTDLGQTGNLPGGVLQLFSDGLLACSINVGGATTGGQCGVNYSAYGNHSVVTTYSLSGIAPVTETDTENIEPFATSMSVSTPLIGSTTVSNDFYYQTVSVPVTVSGLTQSLGTSGTVSLTNTDAINESCQALAYSAQLGSASTTCTAEVENDPTLTTSWTPAATFTGDGSYASSGVTGSVVTIPVAPAPTETDLTVTLRCAESGGFCTEYQPSPETTNADTEVYAGPMAFDVSPNVGTVTFVSADHLTICTGPVFSALGIASNNGRCTGNGGPFEGPITVTYSGGSVETGDTVLAVYSTATVTGGSN